MFHAIVRLKFTEKKQLFLNGVVSITFTSSSVLSAYERSVFRNCSILFWYNRVFDSWMACYLSTIREEIYATRQYLDRKDLFRLGALFAVLYFMVSFCSWDKLI